jgi:glycosyltransferase 2 family protein
MASTLRTHLNFLIGLIISAAAVYLSLRKIDFDALWASLRSVHYIYLLPALGTQLSCFVLKGAGWRFLLLPAKKEIKVMTATSVLVIGLMANNLFPAKLGELVRGYLMGEKENLPKSLCLSTVAVEHLLDILVLTIFLVALLPSVALPPWLQTGGMLVGFAALGMIIVIFILVRRQETFLRWTGKLLSHLPERFRGKIQSVLFNVIQGTKVVTGRYILYAVAALFSMWLMVFLTAYMVLNACGLALPIQAAVMMIIFVAFGKIIPSSPSAIGTYHYLVILVLMSFGVSKEAALGCAIIMHAFGFLVEVSLGLAFLFAGNLSLVRISRRAEEPP